ncbi:aldehyde dehydrogenase [Ferruginibacter yonginensis]|uniref:Aldehyde dehydrogenase n=1 Tax=Ferruginibacter yonginensis TaxID=1310416 RepID=A0ABV8QTY7_9BACT
MESVQALRQYFETGATQSYTFRLAQLEKLKASVQQHEVDIFEALHKDLRKSKEECWITENGFFLSEIGVAIKQLKSWMQPKKVTTNLLNFPSKSYIVPEPLGVTLIISPWNYPFQLLLTPLIGAIAAGNCVVLKPSELAPATAAVIKKIIESTFDKNYILYVEGDGATVVPELMNNFVFDHVFYTGSTAVGKIIYSLAAKNLVPVTLELGGKSPCVVTANAHIDIAAKRIAMPKFSNAGQMCVAPDYILVHRSVKDALIDALKKNIQSFFGDNPQQSDYYGRIINAKQFDRLCQYLQDGKILMGGQFDHTDLYIAPTLIEITDLNKGIMQDEIFGPILPIITYDDDAAALKIIAQHKNPLAMYVFTNNTTEEQQWIKAVPFGGGCINNASLHLTNHRLPFGGRGASGLGNYHGRFSFDTFSHKKAIMKTPNWLDLALKYPPYTGKLSLFKKAIK